MRPRFCVIDVNTLQVIKKIPTESKPDGSAYAAPFHKLYVSDGDGEGRCNRRCKPRRDFNDTSLRQRNGNAADISRREANLRDLQGQNILAEIDPSNDHVVGMHPVGKCKGNHGMALDPEHHRAFSRAREIAFSPFSDLEKHDDRLSSDGGWRGRGELIRVSTGLTSPATVARFPSSSRKYPDYYPKLADVPVAHAVHSIAVDTETHRVYATEQEQDGMPVARLVYFEAAKK